MIDSGFMRMAINGIDVSKSISLGKCQVVQRFA